jgi:hypothetical protein
MIKRVTKGLLGLTIVAIALLSCEKFDGPAPFLCQHTVDNLVVVDPAGAPVGSAIPLESLQALIVNDLGIAPVVSLTEPPAGIPIEAIGKIVFTP